MKISNMILIGLGFTFAETTLRDVLEQKQVPVLEDSLLIGSEEKKEELKIVKEEITTLEKEVEDKPIKRMASIKVRKPKVKGSAADLLAKRAKAGMVMEGVSAEQIAKGTDSDAGALAKRVTGTSVVGGKFVFVRGLGENYTSMTLNGLPVPSPEKGKRIVPQDLFPASALENFTIFKTFSAEIDPHFAGGHIALETKGIPDKDIFKLKVGSGGIDYANDGQFLNWGQPFYTYDGGDGWQTYFGLDDGTRALPNDLPKDIASDKYTDEEIAAFQKKLNPTWAVDGKKIKPNQSYNLSFGKVFKDTIAKSKWGFLFNGGFKRQQKMSRKTKVKLGPDVYYKEDGVEPPKDTVAVVAKNDTTAFGTEYKAGDTLKTSILPVQKLFVGDQENIEQASEKVTLTGIANFGYENRNHKLWAKLFHATISNDVTSYNLKQKLSGATGLNDDFEERFALDYSRRSISTAQFGGGHYIAWGALDSMSWAASYALTDGETPDRRLYRYTRDKESFVAGQDTSVFGRDYKKGETYGLPSQKLIQVRDAGSYGTRTWDELNEWSIAGRTDFWWAIPPEWSREDVFGKKKKAFNHWTLPMAKSGFAFQRTKRNFNATRYAYGDGGGYISNPDKQVEYFVEKIRSDTYLDSAITKGTSQFLSSPNSWDRYEFSEQSISTYLHFQWQWNTFSIPSVLSLGTRAELYQFDFFAPYTGSAEGDRKPIDTKEGESNFDFFPAASFELEPMKKVKTRALFSRTVVRPQVKEFSPFTSYNFDTGEVEQGNPDLIKTEILNYDFRADAFLPYNQILSFSAFYKDFQNPIEATRRDGGGGNLTKTWVNAPKAFAAGLEGEFEVKLNKVFPFLNYKDFLNGFTFYSNAAIIRSEVKIDPNSPETSQLTTFKRPMVGQSEYLLNWKFSHEKKWKKWSVLNGLLFNKFGERLKEVGQDNLPDTWEQPFSSLDYVFKLGHGDWGMSIKIKNILLDEKTIIAREFNNTKSYEKISDATRDDWYKDLKELEYVVEKEVPGISYSISTSYSF